MKPLDQSDTMTGVATSPELDAQAIVAQLLEPSPAAVTYAAIEAAISAAGFDPLEAQDLYLQVLQSLDSAGVLAVERLEELGGAETLEDEALKLADETLAQLRKVRRNINPFSHKLLTAADERRLLEVYHDGKRAADELHPDLSCKQRRALEQRIASGAEALDELISHNMRLVAAQAYKVAAKTRHLDAEDLVQEGLIGLQRAIELYRLDLGYRLSTYASFWIRQAISRAVADLDRMVRLPVHLVESLNFLRRATYKLTSDLGRSPTDEELATACNYSVARVRQLQILSRDHLSLDRPVGAEGDSTLGDVIPDTKMLEPETALMERSRHEAICQFLENDDVLTANERKIITLRFGLRDGERRTLQEIGDLFHVTRERIRQIEVRALNKLKRDARRIQLQTYLED